LLSYQHGYHAGNAADVFKHALLAWMLDYLTQKDKPLSYVETHAGRGLYDLSGAQAVKTGEAAAGLGRLEGRFPADHPYLRVLAKVRGAYGRQFYPGSPLIAALMLRPDDRIELAERHPGEYAELADLFQGWDAPRVRVRFDDGFAMARALVPPEPRRGLMLVDPSFETSADYDDMPAFLARIARVWNVGILVLWYPILREPRHTDMLAALQADHPDAARLEARFPPARDGHRMVGTGLFVIRPPWGLADEAARMAALLDDQRRA